MKGIIPMQYFEITVTSNDEIQEAGQFFIGATFDGMSHKCFLDTGATITTVKNDSTFSPYASLRDMQFMGINGDTSVASRIFIKDIQMGGKSLGGLEIARLPNEGNFHFTIGVDLLHGRRVLFDFNAHGLAATVENVSFLIRRGGFCTSTWLERI
jgi:hypothetical protein